jgi:hypothetical protein
MFETSEIRSGTLYGRKLKFSKWLSIILDTLRQSVRSVFLCRFGQKSRIFD